MREQNQERKGRSLNLLPSENENLINEQVQSKDYHSLNSNGSFNNTASNQDTVKKNYNYQNSTGKLIVSCFCSCFLDLDGKVDFEQERRKMFLEDLRRRYEISEFEKSEEEESESQVSPGTMKESTRSQQEAKVAQTAHFTGYLETLEEENEEDNSISSEYNQIKINNTLKRKGRSISDQHANSPEHLKQNKKINLPKATSKSTSFDSKSNNTPGKKQKESRKQIKKELKVNDSNKVEYLENNSLLSNRSPLLSPESEKKILNINTSTHSLSSFPIPSPPQSYTHPATTATPPQNTNTTPREHSYSHPHTHTHAHLNHQIPHNSQSKSQKQLEEDTPLKDDLEMDYSWGEAGRAPSVGNTPHGKPVLAETIDTMMNSDFLLCFLMTPRILCFLNPPNPNTQTLPCTTSSTGSTLSSASSNGHDVRSQYFMCKLIPSQLASLHHIHHYLWIYAELGAGALVSSLDLALFSNLQIKYNQSAFSFHYLNNVFVLQCDNNDDSFKYVSALNFYSQLVRKQIHKLNISSQQAIPIHQ